MTVQHIVISRCTKCDLDLDHDVCPRCGNERDPQSGHARKPPPVVEHLTRHVLERDDHQCRGMVAGGDRCPATTGLVVHNIGSGPIVFAATDELVTLCRRHAKEAGR